MAAPVIVWLRRNLRLADNPALLDASGSGHPVLSVYVRDGNRLGAASDRASDRPETRSLPLAGLAVARGRTRRVAQGRGGSASELPILPCMSPGATDSTHHHYTVVFTSAKSSERLVMF